MARSDKRPSSAGKANTSAARRAPSSAKSTGAGKAAGSGKATESSKAGAASRASEGGKAATGSQAAARKGGGRARPATGRVTRRPADEEIVETAPARKGRGRAADEVEDAAPARREKKEAKLTPEEKKAAKALKKEQNKGRFGRRLLKIGFLRRRYIKRVMKSIEKSKAKGKRMPPELWELSKRLDRLPPGKQVEFLDQAITAGPEAQEEAGRAMRRAASNQERMSGKGGGRYRPGMGPMPPGARRGKPR